ncbi:MAG: hydroxyacylglutathione hydrolase [Microbacteriaceae bacterium]|nr:hydroxyacylglutathione hydrolase [Microbacteriaceae bacterium]
MDITGTIQKQAWVDKTVPPIEQVRPQVWSVPIDFHFSPVRYTFSYLVTNDAGECIVIDPGWDSELGWKQLTDGLAAAGLTLESVVGIVSTHLHADHLGMVQELIDKTGAWFGMHPLEDSYLAEYPDVAGARERDNSFSTRLGVPQDKLELTALTTEEVVYTHALARPTLLLQDGDILPLAGRQLRVLFTPGHTSGHVCIVDEQSGVIFTGDHILPRITPNVGMNAYRGQSALTSYYESLERMPEFDHLEVLPAHEYRFYGLSERAEALRVHHEERSAEIVEVVSDAGSLTVWQIAERISWARGWTGLNGLNLRAALAETAAHVQYLASVGRLQWGAPGGGSDSWVATLAA